MYLSKILSPFHRRNEFNSGNESLDNYLKTLVNQDISRKLSACFILSSIEDESKIKGYYTLSNNSIPLELIPEQLQNKLPKSYKNVPTTLLGRLAIDKKYQGTGLGKKILIDALKRCFEVSKIIGSFAVVVDPIDEKAFNFYEKYGFIRLPDSGKMFLPMKIIKQLFE
jgi:GNAT superfamily N-acetyltransferase